MSIASVRSRARYILGNVGVLTAAATGNGGIGMVELQIAKIFFLIGIEGIKVAHIAFVREHLMPVVNVESGSSLTRAICALRDDMLELSRRECLEAYGYPSWKVFSDNMVVPRSVAEGLPVGISGGIPTATPHPRSTVPAYRIDWSETSSGKGTPAGIVSQDNTSTVSFSRIIRIRRPEGK